MAPVRAAEAPAHLSPVMYVMLDWFNGDWGNPDFRYSYDDGQGGHYEYQGQPELGALGGWTEFHWSDLNPAKNVYDWTLTDQYIRDAQDMSVTLPDGSVIAKPIGIAVVTWTADTVAGAIGVNYIPLWVASQGGGSTFTCSDPDGSGPCLPFCTPRYANTVWQYWFDQFVVAMGQHYDGNPEFYNLDWVAIATGVDEEVVERKNLNGCTYYYGDSIQFTNWVIHVFQTFNLAFPNTPHFIQGTQHNNHIFAQQALGYPSQMSGVKCNGMEPDVSSAELHLDGQLVGGVTGFSEVYHEYIPTGYEPKRGNGIEGSYWFFMESLATHPYMFDVQLRNLQDTHLAEQRTGFPILDFVRNHLGKSIENTPDVWIMLRDTYRQDTSYTGSDGVLRTYGPHHGDAQFWLYRSDSAPGSHSFIMRAESLAELPTPARSHVYAWMSTRRTDQATGNPYMSFDIEDRYPYAGQVPEAAGGQVSWQITVTLVNTGTDSLSLEYLDYYGNLVERSVTKGTALGTVNQWVDYSWNLDDAYFNNGLPGGMDFRIDCNNDGNEFIHRLIVRADGPPPPTPTPTRTRPPTSTPTQTLTPTRTGTPTNTPTGTITPPTLTPTRTRTPTATLTPTSGPSRTPTNSPTPGPSFTPTGVPTLFPGGHVTVTLQQGVLGYQSTNDTYLTVYTPGGDFSTQANMLVKNDSLYECLLRFDLGSIPSGATIQQAQLRLYAYNRDKSNPLEVQVYRLLRPWIDAQANWNNATAYTAWASPGANDTTSDREADPVTTQVLSDINTWYSFDITPLVREWVSDAGLNNGVVLRGVGSISLVYHFASANHPTLSTRPQLVVEYTASLTPTPATATPTATQTATASATPLVSPTRTATASGTLVISPSPTPTASATTVLSPTPSSTATMTPTATATASSTPAPSLTPTVGPTLFPGGHVTVTLQQGVLGYQGTNDTYMAAYTPAGSFSLQANIVVKNDSLYASLLRFALGSIPPGSTIQQAKLRLYVYNRSSSTAMAVGVYRLLRPWVDAQANWNNAATGFPWGAAGANDTVSDRSADAVVTQTVSGINTWYDFDITALVRVWVSDAGLNNGVVLRGNGGASVEYHFASANHPTLSQRPQLVIEYTAPLTPTPPTVTPTATRTMTPSGTPTVLPTRTPTASATPVMSPTPTITATVTPTVTATASLTPTPASEERVANVERRLGVIEQVLRAIIGILQRAGRLGR